MRQEIEADACWPTYLFNGLHIQVHISKIMHNRHNPRHVYTRVNVLGCVKISKFLAFRVHRLEGALCTILSLKSSNFDAILVNKCYFAIWRLHEPQKLKIEKATQEQIYPNSFQEALHCRFFGFIFKFRKSCKPLLIECSRFAVLILCWIHAWFLGQTPKQILYTKMF